VADFDVSQLRAFGRALRQARARHGFRSQDALADRLGVTRQTVSLWENGETVPQPALMAELQAIFGSDLPSIDERMVPTDRELAYWQGRVDQIAEAMESILKQQQRLSRDMAGNVAPTAGDKAGRFQGFTSHEVDTTDQPKKRRGNG
jgi:transcriptional regulator with XRE-family HTH domain